MEDYRVFPLPLTAWERCMMRDDRPRYPMTFVISLEVSGTLQRVALEDSLKSTLQRHPLLRSRVVRTRFGRWCWVLMDGDSSPIDWAEADVPLRPAREFMDLTQEPGLRVWVREGIERSRLTFQFHHAATDGLGGTQFLGDLLAAYGQATALPGEEVPVLQPVDPARLRLRGDFGSRHLGTWRQRLADIALFLQEVWQLLARPTQPLAGHDRTDVEREIAFPAMLTRRLNRQETIALREVATKKQVSPNDLYLREMFLTLQDWNRSHGVNQPDHWLRVGMPMSMRTERHDAMSSANVMSVYFLARRFRAPMDAEKLLRDLHRQTDHIVNHRLGWFFTTAIEWASRIPGAMNVAFSDHRCVATATLANVGDIRRQMSARFPRKRGKLVVGNLVLEGFEGAGPVRPQTLAAISLGNYTGELIVNLHPDVWRWSNADANEFLDQFVSRLRAVTGGGSREQSLHEQSLVMDDRSPDSHTGSIQRVDCGPHTVPEGQAASPHFLNLPAEQAAPAVAENDE